MPFPESERGILEGVVNSRRAISDAGIRRMALDEAGRSLSKLYDAVGLPDADKLAEQTVSSVKSPRDTELLILSTRNIAPAIDEIRKTASHSQPWGSEDDIRFGKENEKLRRQTPPKRV